MSLDLPSPLVLCCVQKGLHPRACMFNAQTFTCIQHEPVNSRLSSRAGGPLRWSLCLLFLSYTRQEGGLTHRPEKAAGTAAAEPVPIAFAAGSSRNSNDADGFEGIGSLVRSFCTRGSLSSRASFIISRQRDSIPVETVVLRSHGGDGSDFGQRFHSAMCAPPEHLTQACSSSPASSRSISWWTMSLLQATLRGLPFLDLRRHGCAATSAVTCAEPASALRLCGAPARGLSAAAPPAHCLTRSMCTGAPAIYRHCAGATAASSGCPGAPAASGTIAGATPVFRRIP